MKLCIALGLLTAGLALAGCSKPEPLACQAPREHWQKPHNFDGLTPMLNEVALTHDGSVHWNGQRISPTQFSKYLAGSHGLNPEPIVFLQTEMGVSCRTLEAVRNQMEQALECNKPYSRCAEGIKQVWGNLPTPPGTPPP
jgi:biopolymer transport protein ExbD